MDLGRRRRERGDSAPWGGPASRPGCPLVEAAPPCPPCKDPIGAKPPCQVPTRHSQPCSWPWLGAAAWADLSRWTSAPSPTCGLPHTCCFPRLGPPAHWASEAGEAVTGQGLLSPGALPRSSVGRRWASSALNPQGSWPSVCSVGVSWGICQIFVEIPLYVAFFRRESMSKLLII